MLPVKYFHSYTCLITVVGGKQGHAACKILSLLHMSYNCGWGVSKGMLPVKYFHSYTCLITVVGGKQGHAACKILSLLHMSYNCG